MGGGKKSRGKYSFSSSIDQGIYSTSGISAEGIVNPEAKVRFSFKHCDTDKYCLSKLKDNQEAERLNKTLGHYEDFEWRQIQSLKREQGFSIEKKESDNHKMLSKLYPSFSTFAHFRVTGVSGLGTYRVFGARVQDLFYVLLLDREGVVNGKSHN